MKTVLFSLQTFWLIATSIYAAYGSIAVIDPKEDTLFYTKLAAMIFLTNMWLVSTLAASDPKERFREPLWNGLTYLYVLLVYALLGVSLLIVVSFLQCGYWPFKTFLYLGFFVIVYGWLVSIQETKKAWQLFEEKRRLATKR